MTKITAELAKQLENKLAQGIDLFYKREFDKSESCYREILSVVPQHPKTIHYLAHIYAAKKQYDTAIELGVQSSQYGNNDDQLKIDLGLWYISKTDFEAAIDQLSPLKESEHYYSVHEYLCMAHRKLNQLEASIHHAKLAVAIGFNKFRLCWQQLLEQFLVYKTLSNNAIFHLKQTTVKMRQQSYTANEWFKLCMKARFELHTSAAINKNLSLSWLHSECKQPDRYHQQLMQYQYWRGEPLTDKTILVLPEQGIGDEIFFSNTIADVIADAKHCIISCDRRLKTLYQRSFPAATIYACSRDQTPWEQDKHRIDYVVFIGSLLLYYRKEKTDFPAINGWLKLNTDQLANYRAYLNNIDQQMKIGIAWRSKKNRLVTNSSADYLDLNDLLPLFQLPNITFVNLQYDNAEQELIDFQRQHDISIVTPELDLLNDIDGTAHLLSALDLSITPFISTHALAGAIGAPLWVLQTPMIEFNFCGEERSPFYPHIRNFKKQTYSDWQPAIIELKQAVIIEQQTWKKNNG